MLGKKGTACTKKRNINKPDSTLTLQRPPETTRKEERVVSLRRTVVQHNPNLKLFIGETKSGVHAGNIGGFSALHFCCYFFSEKTTFCLAVKRTQSWAASKVLFLLISSKQLTKLASICFDCSVYANCGKTKKNHLIKLKCHFCSSNRKKC